MKKKKKFLIVARVVFILVLIGSLIIITINRINFYDIFELGVRDKSFMINLVPFRNIIDELNQSTLDLSKHFQLRLITKLTFGFVLNIFFYIYLRDVEKVEFKYLTSWTLCGVVVYIIACELINTVFNYRVFYNIDNYLYMLYPVLMLKLLELIHRHLRNVSI